jgi:hypothetical protein
VEQISEHGDPTDESLASSFLFRYEPIGMIQFDYGKTEKAVSQKE